jgi:hypothetical protein
MKMNLSNRRMTRQHLQYWSTELNRPGAQLAGTSVTCPCIWKTDELTLSNVQRDSRNVGFCMSTATTLPSFKKRNGPQMRNSASGTTGCVLRFNSTCCRSAHGGSRFSRLGLDASESLGRVSGANGGVSGMNRRRAHDRSPDVRYWSRHG